MKDDIEVKAIQIYAISEHRRCTLHPKEQYVSWADAPNWVKQKYVAIARDLTLKEALEYVNAPPQ